MTDEQVLHLGTYDDAINALVFAADTMNAEGDLIAGTVYRTGASYLDEVKNTANVMTPVVGAIDVAHLERQRRFSLNAFGPGPRTLGVLDHIRKELVEIEADPTDLGEWVDLIILALDGAWRSGHEPADIINAIKDKQAINEARTWPDWRGRSTDEAIEHDRTV